MKESMKFPWLWLKRGDLAIERAQAEEEGRDISALAGTFDALQSDAVPEDEAFQSRARELLAASIRAPMRPDYRYVEPSDLEGIRAARPDAPRVLNVSTGDAELRDRLHGALLGRCAGCLLGKPVEGWRTNALWPMLREAGHSMLTDYFWRLGISAENLARHKVGSKPATKLFAAYDHMPEDDDTNYTLTGMAIVKNKGVDFRPADVADFWVREIPLLHTCTAERVAYRNFAEGIAPPDSATVANPYREWIGAQIRADFFGYVAMGRPEFAAELAWRDACISHVKNGIYGEMWVAAMLAGAAVETDLRRIVEIGLGEIPARCRLAENLRMVLDWHAGGVGYDDAVARIHRQWDEHSAHGWCHTISNAQIVAMGLLWSEGDFEKAITRAVWPGFDTDCNGATVGSLMGMRLGAAALPAKWTDTLHDTLRSGLASYHKVSIAAMAGEMFDLYQKARGATSV